MKIVIVGPGAMGCLFGAFLARSGQDVYFLDKNARRAGEIERKGILVEGISGRFVVRKIKAVTKTQTIGKAELIIIATKSYDTEEAIRRTVSLLDKESLILTLQNGLGNVEIMSKYVPQTQIIAGITAEGATLLANGHVRHAGRGETVMGMLQATGRRLQATSYRLQAAKLEEISQVFNNAGFETKITENVMSLIWSKLIINVGINALTALTRLNNGRLIEFDATKKIMEEAVNEAVAVARKKKIKLSYPDPLEKVQSVCRATYGNVSSMLQDIVRRKRTEIDFINGAIVREGQKLGISTPVNSVLTNLVKAIESSYVLQVK